MNIEYTWQRKDLEKQLYKKRNKANLIYLILSIFLFFYITYYGFIYNEFDNWLLILGFIIYIVVILLLLYITTKIYVKMKLKRNDKITNNAYGTYKLDINDTNISVKYNNEIIIFKWEDINKIKISNHKIFLRTKADSIGLTFYKNLFNESDYNKLVQIIKTKK